VCFFVEIEYTYVVIAHSEMV